MTVVWKDVQLMSIAVQQKLPSVLLPSFSFLGFLMCILCSLLMLFMSWL